MKIIADMSEHGAVMFDTDRLFSCKKDFISFRTPGRYLIKSRLKGVWQEKLALYFYYRPYGSAKDILVATGSGDTFYWKEYVVKTSEKGIEQPHFLYTENFTELEVLFEPEKKEEANVAKAFDTTTYIVPVTGTYSITREYKAGDQIVLDNSIKTKIQRVEDL